MPKNEGHGCCGGHSRFWWGVLVGVILAAALHVIVMCGRCHMGGGAGCPMGKAAAMEKSGGK